MAVNFVDTDEHKDLRAAVAKIAGGFGGTYYAEHAAAHEPCRELWSAMGQAGFIGVNIPEAYGGGGGGLVELAIVCEEAAAQGAPLLLLLVSAAISAEVISEFGTNEQRQQWLPGLAAGTSTVVFAITEPDAGSNTHKISTTATRDGADWLLSGTKYYISGMDEAEAVLVVARTGRDASGAAQMSLFLVPADAPGLQKSPLPVDAMLPERQYTLFFDDVRIGAQALVGEEGQGFRQVFHGLNPERITGAALCVGIARYALGRATEYATSRQVWDTPIGAHQGVSHPLAKAKIETELAALMTAKAAWLHDQGRLRTRRGREHRSEERAGPRGREHRPSASEGGADRLVRAAHEADERSGPTVERSERRDEAEASNMAKYAAAEAALAAIDAAIQTHGGNGLATEYGLVPYWGMARLLRIAPVNREMILNFVAQHSLGLPKSY